MHQLTAVAIAPNTFTSVTVFGTANVDLLSI